MTFKCLLKVFYFTLIIVMHLIDDNMFSSAPTFIPPAIMPDSQWYWLTATTAQQLHLQKSLGNPPSSSRDIWYFKSRSVCEINPVILPEARHLYMSLHCPLMCVIIKYIYWSIELHYKFDTFLIVLFFQELSAFSTFHSQILCFW